MTSPQTPAPNRPTPNRPAPTRTSRIRPDQMTTTWMLLALAAIAVGQFAKDAIPQVWWTTIHLVTLGVLSNSILQWSWHFARALLRLPADNKHANQHQRLRQLLCNIALVGLIAAMWTSHATATIIGAGAIGAILAWHAVGLIIVLREKFGSRFAIVIRYYVVAAFALVAGCVYAGFITVAMFSADVPQWILDFRSDLTLAHGLVNVAGWVGLSIAGTLVTLWPTVLRTRMEPDAAIAAIRALPFITGGLILAVLAASFGWLPLAGFGLLVYVGALGWGVGLPIFRTVLRRRPNSYPSWNIALGVTWIGVGLVILAIQMFLAPSADAWRDTNTAILALIGAGGLLQVLMGALAYLMPVVIGGGAVPVRLGNHLVGVGGVLRVSLRNAALLFGFLITTTASSPPEVSRLWWLVLIATYGADVVGLAVAGVKQSRARNSLAVSGGNDE